MQSVLDFLQSHKAHVDAVHAASAVVNLLGWLIGAILLSIAWRRNQVRSYSFGPLNFELKEAAVSATATAVRSWNSTDPQKPIDLPLIRSTVGQAFEPETAAKIAGRSILWVDDNPSNNRLAVRALRKLLIDIDQATSTDAALTQMQSRRYDLIISDMGRGTNMVAGYELLEAVRSKNLQIPFFIFAGSDTPHFRKQAAERGAQLSTNDMIELFAEIISTLRTS